MGFLKRTNKKFDYKPRFYKGEGNPFEIGHKFDEFRTTIGKNKGLKGKVLQAIDELKSPKDDESKRTTKVIFTIVAILVLVFLFIIDFDLSIFTK